MMLFDPASTRAAAEDMLPDLVELRRAIHAHPEIGLHNPHTRERIMVELAALPLEYREGPSTSGVVAVLRGSRPGPVVLLRGDTDALPMHEETGLAYSSQVDGAMHACGHDTHVAMLVGAARLLSARRDSLSGTVLFMFQPGEEGYHGARFMMNDGLLDPKPDAAFALHIMPNAPHGLIAGRVGPLLAAADRLNIRVIGRGGHASMPHEALDPVPIACEIVSAIQSLVTRKVSVFDPAVVTIAKVSAGTAHNFIPEHADIEGTIRTLSPERRAAMARDLERLATGIANAHGAEAQFSIEQGFPVTICDGAAVAFGQRVAQRLAGPDSWQTLANPIMGAEDFAYVLEQIPGAMFFLGASHQGTDWRTCCGLHSNHMVLDEKVMPLGAAYLASLAEQFLASGFDG